MTMLKTLSSVFLKCSFVLVSCCATAPVFAQSTPKPSPGNGYPADYGAKHLKNCVKNGISKGVNPEIVNQYCSCMSSQIQAKIPYEKLKALSDQTKKTGKPSSEIKEISSTCRKQSLPRE